MDRSKPLIIDHAILKQKDNIPLKQVHGHTLKAFAKLYDKPRGLQGIRSKHRLFFGELFKELMSGNSSYVTYLNDGVVGKKKRDAKIPDYVRCIIKEMPSPTAPYYGEIVGSRLANLLGVDTVYNMAHQIDPDDELSAFDYDYLISVDYVPDGFTDFTFDNIGVCFEEDSLEDIMINIDRALRRLNKTGRISADLESVESFKEDFVKQFLFRSLLCEDQDYCSRNTSLLISKNGDFRLGPCFDMELMFQGKRSTSYYKSTVARDFEFLLGAMPDVLEEFLYTCNSALKSGDVARVMTDSISVGPDMIYQNYKMMVMNNIKTMTSLYQEMKKDSLPEM